MKIIISPSKTFNLQDKQDRNLSQPEFFLESQQLRELMKKYKPEELQSIFKTSEKLTKTAYNFYHQTYPDQAAIDLYKGQVFSKMKLESWNKKDFDFAQEHLIILSALYGKLKPMDAIKPYRLDFNMKLDINLYSFWKDKIQLDDKILNLASNEFSKLFSKDQLINVHFIEKNGKTQSTKAKQARGEMIHKIIKNKNIQSVRDIEMTNYQYKAEQSDDNNIVFRAKEY